MKKVRFRALGLSVFMSAALLLSACGSDGVASPKYVSEEAYETGYGVYDNAAMTEEATMDSAGTSSGTEVVDTSSRKLITTVNMDTETEDLDETLSSVESKVKSLGGYIESSNIYNGTSHMGSSTRSANLTARIPAERLDDFIDMVEGSTNITRKSVNVDDVTLTYVDIESKRNSLRTEEKRLLEIMDSAETVEDIIAVEDKLADVRYNLESIESQLRSYDNLVDYSTVYLNIEEVVYFTPVEKENIFDRMTRGFTENLAAVGEGIIDCLVYFVAHLPQIILFILVILIIFIIIRLINAVSKKKRMKQMAMMQAQYQNMQGQAAAPQQGTEKGNNGQQ